MAGFDSLAAILSGPSRAHMRRISSRGFFFYKTILPPLWLAVGALLVFVASSAIRAGLAMFLFWPAIAWVLGCLLMRKLVLNPAAEVWDAGDALLVKKGNQEELILLSNIMNVAYSTFPNSSPLVTLMLRQACRFGKEVSFYPRGWYFPLAKGPIIDELIQRIDQQRRR